MTFAQLDDELQYAGALKAADNCENYGTSQPTGQPYAPEKASKPPLFREVLPSGNQTRFARKLITHLLG